MSTLSPTDKRKLEGYGFDISGKSTINTKRRLIMAVSAEDKNGKTGFGLSAPPPVMHFNFDRKVEASALETLGIDPKDIIINEVRVDAKEALDKIKRKWQQVRDGFLWALREADSVRSIVIDTETEMWALARLAEFGKISQVMPHQYVQVNQTYKALLDEADKCDKNVIFLRKMKKEYKNENWTGNMETSGFSQLPYIMQVNGLMYRDKDEDGQEQFNFEIINNALKASLNGMEFSGSMCSFKWVAAMLTGTTPDEWE